VTNAIADDPECQAVFMKNHEDLLEVLLNLTNVDSYKLKAELCFMIDNILHSPHTKSFLFNVPKKLTPSKEAISNISR